MDRDVQSRHYVTVARAIEFIRAHVKQQPTLEQIAEAVHMSPFHLQRVFSEWAGLSPKRFLQYLTKEHAKSCLLQSQTVQHVAHELGMSSSSRLHDLMVTSEAMTPGDIQSGGDGLQIGYGVGESPFGSVFLAWTPRGICQFAFLNQMDQTCEALALRLKQAWPRASMRQDDSQARLRLDEIFQASPSPRHVHLMLRGTNFQIKVWEALIKTQPGDVLSYQQVAQRIGHPRSQRAVGTALSLNDIGVLIPCHRVIQGSGDPGQYRWGAPRKMALQIWEHASKVGEPG